MEKGLYPNNLLLHLFHKNVHSFLFNPSHKNMHFPMFETLSLYWSETQFSTNNTLFTFYFLPLLLSQLCIKTYVQPKVYILVGRME